MTRATLATLGYVLSADGEDVLLIHRNARTDDHHFGKYNGLGGKVEADEDLASGLQREIREEAGIACEQVEFAGTVYFPGFGVSGEGWFVSMFLIPVWSGTPLARNDEGDLHWVSVADVLAGNVPMWTGDRHFLPLVFADPVRQFHGVMTYSNGQPEKWRYSLL